MAEAKLNFDEEALDKQSSLYDLYSRLYEGMRVANTVDAPSVIDNPPLNEEGEVDNEAIAASLADYSEILMKNSAYLFANSILSVTGSPSGGNTGGVGFISRTGDAMSGNLAALYGFQSGYNGQQIFETTLDSNDKRWANVTGSLSVSEDAVVEGRLQLSGKGIYWGANQVVYYSGTTLHLASQEIAMAGAVQVDGSIQVGDVVIDENGINWGENEFYHSGNANNKDTDWTMKNAYVYGDLSVEGAASFNGRLTALQGFDLGENGQKLFWSEYDEAQNTSFVWLGADLALVSGYGIKFDGTYILKVRGGDDSVVSLYAPGKTLNLGDSDGEIATDHIALQSTIWNYDSSYKIVSQYGDGNFPNSFSAGSGNSGPTVMQTYHAASDDSGVVFYRNIRLGDSAGPALYGDNSLLKGTLPYTHNEGKTPATDHIQFSWGYETTTSLFRDLSKDWSATLHLSTDAEFITFDNPVEAESFSIKSELYKTRLLENTLFFNDGIFLEGAADGIRHAGNGYFDGDISSPTFASGFAGYGWAVKEDEMVGGFTATFDSLTVRKKMKVYELEVQKISVTNGSLWVSDSCSGDEVKIVS